jgi:hypothetical protein
VKKLESLLAGAASALADARQRIAKSVGEKLDPDLVDPQQVTVAWQPSDDAVWELGETRTFWRTRALTFQVRAKTGGDPLKPLSDVQPIRFVASNGSLNTKREELTELAVGLADATNRHVEQLSSTGQEKIEQVLLGLRNQGWDAREAANSTNTQPAWTLKLPRFVDRELRASWNTKTLTFDAEAWNNTVAEIGGLTQRLAEIDRSITDPGHWMRSPWNGVDVPLLQEARAPKNGKWPLMLPAPWAPNANQNPEMLYLDATIEGDKPKFEPPFYWPILDRYTELTRTPQPLSGKDAPSIDSAKLAAGDKKLLQELLNLKLFGPQLTLDAESTDRSAPSVEWSCNPDSPQSASLAIAAKINLGRRMDSPVPPEVDKAALDKLLVEVAPAYPCRVEFNHDPKQAADPPQKIQIIRGPPGAADISALKEFDKVLEELPRRIEAESDLEKILHAKETEPLSGDEFRSALDAIWTAKREPAADKPAADTGKLLQGVRTVADSKLCSKSRPGKPLESLTNLHANVFVEYFTGLKATYALGWSTLQKQQPTQFQRGPFLLRIPSLEQGEEVVGRVLSEVFPENQAPNAAELGIVLGADEGLPRDLTTMQFTSRKVDVDDDQASGSTQVTFKSLADLRNVSGRLANYILVPTLFDLVRNPNFRADGFESTWKDSKSSAARLQAIEWRDEVRQR